MSGTGSEVLFGSNLRGSRSLLFISFKKGHTSDTRRATHSSYLNKLSYFVLNKHITSLGPGSSQSMTLGPSLPLRPFMVGYRWTKSYKRVTRKLTHFFYLKDLTWSDNNNNMYLGPVVAAQQVQDPSPQHTHLREEKRGGGGHTRCSQFIRSLSHGPGYLSRCLW